MFGKYTWQTILIMGEMLCNELLSLLWILVYDQIVCSCHGFLKSQKHGYCVPNSPIYNLSLKAS